VEIFSQYDGLTTGDVDDDGEDEIIIASDDDNTIYIYEPDGTLLPSEPIDIVSYFIYSEYVDQWNAYAVGDVGFKYVGDKIVIADEGDDRLLGFRYVAPYGLGFNFGFDDFRFTRFDGFAIREKPFVDEIVVAIDEDGEDGKVYRYDGEVHRVPIPRFPGSEDQMRLIDSFECKFTPYDGFATGDHPGLAGFGGGDEVFIINDEDKKIHIYGESSTGDLVDQWIYSRFLEFDGIRYTGGSSRYDGFGVGNVLPAPGDEIVIAYNRDGPSSSIYYIITDWDARGEGFRNELSSLAPNIDILAHFAHGNQGGSTPLDASDVKNMRLSSHPLVVAFSCLTGYYDGGDSFAEAFFEAGAAVYIGSTEPSPSGNNEEFAKKFFEDYWAPGKTIGESLTDFKRDKVLTSRGLGGTAPGDYWTLVVYEYNLYGDPKFGGE
jgi:hypothetical protein